MIFNYSRRFVSRSFGIARFASRWLWAASPGPAAATDLTRGLRSVRTTQEVIP